MIDTSITLTGDQNFRPFGYGNPFTEDLKIIFEFGKQTDGHVPEGAYIVFPEDRFNEVYFVEKVELKLYGETVPFEILGFKEFSEVEKKVRQAVTEFYNEWGPISIK